MRDDLLAASDVSRGPAFVPAVPAAASVPAGADTSEIKVIGIRRLIAERMTKLGGAPTPEAAFTEAPPSRELTKRSHTSREAALTWVKATCRPSAESS